MDADDHGCGYVHFRSRTAVCDLGCCSLPNAGATWALLAVGQHDSELRDFDTDLMAGFSLSLRNVVILRAAFEPGFDLAACTAELLTMIQLATDPQPTR
ncbi:hypothetical protein AB0M12_29070 [Nocardia vinacea]|uniref:hypothetical protein n=1 Tax=Nocardia vinacea TaxID=96468 RepID=UPI003425D4CD